MSPELINLTDIIGDIAYKLDEVSAVVADLAEMYPMRSKREDYAALCRSGERIEDAMFRFNVRLQVFAENLDKYTKAD